MNTELKQIGRTTRMLNHAKELARQGRAVYVVAANGRHLHDLEVMAGEEAQQLGIKFETDGSLGNFDWQNLCLRGAHPNCVVLVDHYAIECKYATVLEMLNRYNVE